MNTIETYHLDSGPNNHAVLAVVDSEGVRLGTINEPVNPQAGAEFVSRDAEGRDIYGHSTFAEALARFQ